MLAKKLVRISIRYLHASNDYWNLGRDTSSLFCLSSYLVSILFITFLIKLLEILNGIK